MEAQPQQQFSSMPKFEERARRWKVLEILDYKLYRWPGHGVPVDSANSASLHAMIDTCKEYGVYR